MSGTAAADVFAAGGDVGRDLAAMDWDRTPLGDPERWPQSLRTAVSILLSSRFPMWMAWGPELTFFCNAAYRRDTLGRKYPWALGRPANEVWKEIWGDIGPRIENVLRTGEATWDEGLLLFLERSGYSEETYHTFSYSPLRDDDGALVGMLCVVSEDTDRVIGERRMATLRDLGSDPSVVRTEQEMLTFTAQQLGKNLKDLPFTLTYLYAEDGTARLASSTGIPAGHPAAPMVAEPDGIWPGRPEPALIDLAGSDPAGTDLTGAGLPAGDWAEPPSQALLVPLPRQGGAPYGFLVAGLNRYRALDEQYRGFLDLTAGHVAAGIASARSYQAQQRRAEELAELDRAKTTFFSNISHEFRTPLTLIMGPLDELRARAEAGDREELDVMWRNGLRLGKLVNALLDFSRLEAGRMQARYEPVDLAATTAELASVFRSAVERAGLSYEVDCPPLPGDVYVDRGMWEKVVLNLLSNALKFTFDGGVRVTVRADGDQAVVTIADTGVGVPPEEMARLFERFHRIENARSRSNEGSGIGLALVKELVLLHGGTVEAQSTPDRGTTFTIRLPFGPAHLPAGSVVPAAGDAAAVSATADPFVQEALRWLPSDADLPADAPGPVGGDTASVLVADDNADMRDYLVRLLRSAGHRVTAVADGRQALDAARADVPDLVVSDVMMPEMDGLQLVAALRAEGRTAGVPVLLLSARAGQEAAIEGLDAGADDYLFKPFSAAELLARVRANVELARLRNHHSRWRTALVESLQEAFFVCDEDGAVIEVNAAFADTLGYGPDGLPYHAVHPWWPDPVADADAYRQVADAFAMLVHDQHGTYTIPVDHADGHRLWVAAAFSQVRDPETGRKVIVGTFRDVTDEHYAIQRESAVASLSLRLSRADDVRGALAGALDEMRDLWNLDSASAVIFDGATDPRVVATDPAVTWESLPHAAITALRDGPALTPGGNAGISLEHPDGVMVVWLELGERRPFTDPDRTLLALLAGHLGQALRRVHQIDQQRETALALQRAILGPAQLPAGFAVRYEPATRPLRVGGDWYDTVTLPDGRIGIVVGDCVGHGLPAATVMGQLRSACRALLLQDTGPARTLTALDRFAALLPGAACATVFCGVLDPATGHLVYSSAGHPPPIAAHADGTIELLDRGRSRPLAIRPTLPRDEAEYRMPARATLLLYTDGLVERRRQPLTAGIDAATEAVRLGRSTPIEDLASEVMTRLAPETGYDDDVALLLYRQPGPLELEFPAEASRLAPVRTALRGWLERCGIDPVTTQNVLVAAGEACANAIEHGHREKAGQIRLRAAATAENLRLTVVDNGSWRAPRPAENPYRGRGLMLMKAFMHHVTVTTGIAGTTIDMQARIVP
ncbi:putative multi-sensor signal transduction histidine kinase [Actinoplanes missouriensis 431]|uniref:histidine kinase n=1 Tax=Actinoplanes missouriensis (strain ATCC 14538 / DSM 43046 / CBS 188.64 / JCM 3121 / NBRC 102363 / NCIMB 12654 / NRRL B-3342 / UNCC 431) TaxID=512565 RepID=I0HA62_ACTM4|nr:SpoIIE family protein phosphatase [Actinoplanes missouriensis]BAL89899.1 putative multi-sensor signal transduction histidine kinase [Actinoplanes missouriensis 431]